jgi:FAD/FMN-containing dehydrogenase
MRKKAVGLLGNAKGAAKPIPFAEDTCVPPEHLADYIVEFRALLDSHGLSYGMFGHVDAGVLHVRPALDMCDPQQEMLMKQISDDVVALTAKYGGLLWGNTAKASAPSTARRSLARFTASCARSKRRSTR